MTDNLHFLSPSLRKKFSEAACGLWIISCLYIWWVLNGTPGLKDISRLVAVVDSVNTSIYQLVYPFIYKPYIF